MRDADTGTQRYVLSIPILAHAIDDELLRYALRDPRAELGLDEVQHQIERRRPTRAGEAVAVDGEELVADEHAGKFLAQRRNVLPVNGRAIIVEEPRARERIAAGAQRAQCDAPLGETAQRHEQRRRDRLADVHPAADEQDVERFELIEHRGGRELESGTRFARRTVEAHHRPLVNILAHQAIRHAQGLDGIGDGDQGIVAERQKRVFAFA